ncbi:unnamed protein product [Pararhodospirillum photometricum DSM 122]|uniref:Uncharacterized protein n=1 Tax=Pararhodospirillum photometricum DSM 122 TaxID=1150469 RepID=H6SQK4_PARPM|nr:unnamed protein product [Pararhodospirillum photometricum DSM 122]
MERGSLPFPPGSEAALWCQGVAVQGMIGTELMELLGLPSTSLSLTTR